MSNKAGNKKWKKGEENEFRVRAKHHGKIWLGKKCWIEVKESEEVHQGGFQLAKGWEEQKIVYLGVWSKIDKKKGNCVKILVFNNSPCVFQVSKGQRVGWTRKGGKGP